MTKAFGAEVGQSNDPSYIGYSRESSANNSMKKLFSGLATAIDLKSDMYEKQQKDQADATADEIINTTTDQTSVEGATGSDTIVKPTANTDLSPDIKKVAETGKKLTQAYSEGSITQSDYWAKMDSLVRQARARYPSQADRIEQQVAQALGRRPAAAAIEEKREEYKATLASHNEEEKRFATFVDTNIEYLPADFYRRVAEGRPYTKIETRHFVQERQQEKLKVDNARSKLALAKEQGNLNEEDAVGTALDEVTGFTNRIILDTTGTAKNFTDLLRKGREKGKDFTPDEQMALRQQFAELKFKVQEGVENILSKGWADDPATKENESSLNYYNQIKSPEKIKHIKEAAASRIDYYEKLINDKEYGVLNADVNRTQAMKSEVDRKVLEAHDSIRIFDSVKRQGGSDLLDELLLSPEGQKMKSDAAKSLRNITLGRTMSGDAKSLTEEMKRAEQSTVSKNKAELAKLNYQQIKDSTDILASDKAPAQIKSNTARVLFGPDNQDFIAHIKGSQRTEIFTRMISPETTKAMLKLRESDPDSWKLYRNWTKNAFGSIFRDLAASVQEGVTMRPNMNIEWDEGAKQFKVTSTSERNKPTNEKWRIPFAGALRAVEDKFSNNVEQSVTEFNRQIRAMTPILAADGQDIGKELLGFFNSMGIDTMAPKDATWFTKLRGAMIKNFELNGGGSKTDADGKKR